MPPDQFDIDLPDADPPPEQLTEHISFAPDAALAISLAVDPRPGCGGRTWPAGLVLARYLINRPSFLAAKQSIIELGSGTGLVGLVAASLLPVNDASPRIHITDQSPMLPLMHQNVRLNHLEKLVHVAELNWGDPLPDHIPRPDLILAADCVYFEPAFPLLVQTLKDLTENNNVDILFCYKKRRKADKRFFLLLKKSFVWTEVDDDPNSESYRNEAISLLRVSRKK